MELDQKSFGEEHKCVLDKKKARPGKTIWYERLMLVSPENPLRYSYFRSDVALKQEQSRQIKLRWFVIHPFSKFRAWYEVFQIFLYASLLITKPIDAGHIKSPSCKGGSFYAVYNMITDLLSWIDICLHFVTGYEMKNINIIELRISRIVRHYVFGPFFAADVLSSIPKCLIYLKYSVNVMWQRHVIGLMVFLGLFKAVRIVSFIQCIWRTADYFRFFSTGFVFLGCTLFGAGMIIHWLACLQFALPRIARIYLAANYNTSWFNSKYVYNGDLYNLSSMMIRYNHGFFKGSAHILGVSEDLYEMKETDEYVLAIFTYFIGKLTLAIVWIVLAVAILNSRSMQIKFAEKMNQLEAYLKQKQLPENLKGRIIQHISFKYGNKYFAEELITSLLSENLRKEATMHTCRKLVENVSLFADLSPLEISKVVPCLTPEIYLPNDTIIHAGTHGDAMYFLSSGTVAVYTRSGREICHLQDGAYFGEIALVIKHQLRSASVIALETSHVYRLDKKDLQRCLLKNKSVMKKILTSAEKKLRVTTKLDDEYKEVLFEQSYKKMEQ